MKVCRKLLVFLLILLILFVAPAPVMASWLSWLGVGCTVAAIGAAFFPPKGTVVAGVLAIAQLALLFTDAALATRTEPLPEPNFAGPPEPDRLNGVPLAYVQFQHLPLQGDDTDTLVSAANDMIDAFNQYWLDLANGATTDQINDDLLALSESFEALATAYDQLDFTDLELTQTDLNSTIADIQANGLPDYEIQMLRNAGADEDFIQALADYVGGITMNLQASAVSPSEMLHAAATELQIAAGGT